MIYNNHKVNIRYKAISTNQKILKGVLTNVSTSEIELILQSKELSLISYKTIAIRKDHYRILTLKQLHFMWMSLRFYILAGINILEAFKLLISSEIITQKSFQSILEKIYDSLLNGEMLSQAIKKHLDPNDELTPILLHAAEVGGTYQTVLFDLEEWVSWRINQKEALHQALRYPAILLMVVWGSMFCMLYYFVPQLLNNIEKNILENTFWGTHLVIFLSTQVISYPLPFAFLPLIVGSLLLLIKKIFKNYIYILYYIPFLKHFILDPLYVRLSRNLQLQLSNGYSLHSAFINFKNTSKNSFLDKVFKDIYIKIQEGVSFSQALKHHPLLFDNYFIQLISLGEKTNTLVDNFKLLDQFYTRRSQKRTKLLISLCEPSAILLIGIVFMVIVGGVFYPLYQQTNLNNWGL
jgi:type IV pilus assembly protein PilC